MKWLDKEHITNFDEDNCGHMRILQIVIKLMRARIEELEEEVEDVRLEMIEEESRRGE